MQSVILFHFLGFSTMSLSQFWEFSRHFWKFSASKLIGYGIHVRSTTIRLNQLVSGDFRSILIDSQNDQGESWSILSFSLTVLFLFSALPTLIPKMFSLFCKLIVFITALSYVVAAPALEKRVSSWSVFPNISAFLLSAY